MDANTLSPVDRVVIGERLALARRACGLTQQSAAEALGVAQTSIAAMEKGDRRPQPSELSSLCTAAW